MRAFQGLSLTKNRPRTSYKQRKGSLGSANPAKSPIDPLSQLAIVDDDDCNSELTDDHDTTIVEIEEESPAGLYENLQRNWSPGDEGRWEQACFASFCSVFDESLPNPHRVVVTGLWGNVVLPPLMVGTDKMPQLVAQDVWNTLLAKMQYLAEDDCNMVSLAHSVYKDYGLKVAARNDRARWKEMFAFFLQRALTLEGDQPHFVQLYAAKVIVPYWLSLDKVAQAANLLHQPSFISKEWKLLSKEENPLQITKRHAHLMQLYLSKLTSSSTKWQEALGLYQGWHTLLQQEMQINLEASAEVDCNNSQDSGSSSGRQRRKSSARRRKKVMDPMQLLILGRSLFVLSESLDSILTELPDMDAAMSVLWRRQSEYLGESMQVFSQVEDMNIQYLLSAETWLSMSTSCATMDESNVDEVVDIEKLARMYDIDVEGETDELQCLSVARYLLEKAEPSTKSKTLQLLCLSLKAELHDAQGRWLYSKQRYGEARFPLEAAIKTRRQTLALIKDAEPYSSTLFWWGSSRPNNNVDEDVEVLCDKLCLNLQSANQQIKDSEIALAQSLEYAALALHACELSMAATAWLQEALVLKTTHLGKMSLEVARLNSAMAVVNEDMSQWEASLSRYRECLRIRMHVLGQADPNEWFGSHHSLFRSILDTLGAMGSAYRMLGDHDNAVGCYWKTATLSKKEWESMSRDGDKVGFWGFECHRRMAFDLRTTPLPNLVLDEERYSKTPSEIAPPQSAPKHLRNDKNDEENAVLFQAAHAYQSILSLFEDKASKESKNGRAGTSQSNLAGSVAIEDVPVLLAASYRLGLIHIHFGDFRSAVSSLQHSLHALWVLDPSSSDSSSEDEEGFGYSREADRRQRVLQGIFGQEMETVDDEGVYHALGICRAACGEHDQAVRFHLTALKCARRMHGVHSLRTAEILYDAATSYWYLQDYDKAEEFWLACHRIYSREDFDDDESVGNLSAPLFVDRTPDSYCVDEAKVLYCVGASLCALGRYNDNRAQESLEKAQELFRMRADSEPGIEVANCQFYLALLMLKRLALPDVLQLKAASVNLNRASSIYRQFGYLPGGDSTLVQDDPSAMYSLQAHIRFLEGDISEALGKLHLGVDTFTAALHLYRKLEDKRWSLYVASVRHSIGKLRVKMYHDHLALECFEEALVLRRRCLGSDHEAVGETLYQMAEVYGRLGELQKAMVMYHEALRIQMNSEGKDGSAVATTLLMIAALHVKQGNCNAALERLQGSLKIRKQRVELVSKASRVISVWSGDLADEFLAISKEEANTDDGGHVRKALQEDLVKEEVALAVVLHCMGNVYVQLGDNKPAKNCFEDSLRVRRRHPVSAAMLSLDGSIKLHASDTLHNLGCLYELTEDYDNALKYFATALKLKHGMLKEPQTKHPNDPQQQTLVIYDGQGSIEGKFLNSGGSISYALTLHRLGTVHYRSGNLNIALACLDAALRIQKHYLGVHHFKVAQTLIDMGSVLRNMEGKSAEARKYYVEACEIRKLRNRGDADIGHVLFHIGQLFDGDHEFSRAASYYSQAIQAYGHRYVNSVSRRLCEAILRQSSKLTAEAEDARDMFAKEGLAVRSIEETDDLIQSHFSTITTAMRQVSRKRFSADKSITMNLDLSAPDCWISFELYILSLVEILHYISAQVTHNANIAANHALNQLEQAGVDGMKTKPDAITFQMLYLIQE